ncbi:hypothetical protein LUZ60_011257 [Juncus effusus]|nr:hypothetical protein LUZ60_011257 [Juncus effusus]
MNSKAFYRSILFFYRLVLRRLKFIHTTNLKLQKCPSLASIGTGTGTDQHLVFELEGGLLRSRSTFPYFMLVALEAGSFLRGLLLLIFYPFICIFSHEMGLSIMTMIAFCGVRVDGFRLGRVVLSKHFLEDVGLEAFEVLERFKTRVCFTGMPRVMVEGFLREYLGVEKVVGREIRVFGGYFTGFMEGEAKVVASVKMEFESTAKDDGSKPGMVGLGGLEVYSFHEIFSNCKEVYLASETEKMKWQTLPRSRYTKPLIFHDGRIALRPTPLNSLSLFLWLPLSVPLAITRALIFLLLPYKFSVPLLAFLGMPSRTNYYSKMNGSAHTDINMMNRREQTGYELVKNKNQRPKGHIYVCNHRTLLDPLYISGAIGRHITATTYSISRLSEILSPIRTIRLTRNKEVDGRKMDTLLAKGDIVVCPEGTTCREPYLLRFSPLFAELNGVVIPVALSTDVEMFYGTTASGKKFLDPLCFLMNPRPRYKVDFLDEVDTRIGNSLGIKWNNNYDVANYVQNKIGKALGFECTTLTRRDKYMMLADNEGIVQAASKR